MSHRLQRVLAVIAAGALVAAGLLPMPAMAATNWSVNVGADTPDHAIQANAFYNNNITVDVGDTVTWHWAAEEIHTVTFLSGAPDIPLFNVVGGQLLPNLTALLPNGRTT